MACALGMALAPCRSTTETQADPRGTPASGPDAGLASTGAMAVQRGLSRHVFVEVHFGNIPVELTLYARAESRTLAWALRDRAGFLREGPWLTLARRRACRSALEWRSSRRGNG